MKWIGIQELRFNEGLVGMLGFCCISRYRKI
jgi:hypothetical protein